MASLKDIRRRIGSVTNTQQITRAMKMVSAAKLRRAQELISGARPFAEKIEELTGRLLAELKLSNASNKNFKLSSLHPLLKEKNVEEGEKEKVALIIVSSDKGLCGAYNTNVIKAATKKINEIKDEVELSTFYFGKKAFESLRHVDGKGHHDVEFWAGKFSSLSADVVANKFVDEYVQGSFDRVDVIYTEFKSALSQKINYKTLLPLTADELEISDLEDKVVEEKDNDKSYLLKPSKEKLLGGLLETQVKTQFFKLFADSLASEFGSRMTSMDNATRNAKEMIEKLTLKANRVRQASITSELMEIVSGAEALKG